MEERAFSLLERIAVGLEKLSEPINLEEVIEAQPFVCPHCDKINPTITSLSENMSGKAHDYVLKAECGNCHKVIYAIPSEWEIYGDRDAILEAIKERQNGRD